MNESENVARDHYQAAITDIEALLRQLGAGLDGIGGPLTAQALAGFDQFHIGGLAATAALAARLGITADLAVLDAGSGLGGPSRYLAETFGCNVTGVDLAPAYVRIAELLAERAGLAAKVSYHAASITELPFAPAVFDLVWTQHVVMNIPGRAALYRELRRVLKPGGRLAFYDPYAPEAGAAPHYPTPWAETASHSTLLTKAATIAALEQAGFRLRSWEDVTETAQGWLARQRQQQQAPAEGRPTPNLGLVVGPRMQPMVANFARNLAEGRVGLVMGICDVVQPGQ